MNKEQYVRQIKAARLLKHAAAFQPNKMAAPDAGGAPKMPYTPNAVDTLKQKTSPWNALGNVGVTPKSTAKLKGYLDTARNEGAAAQKAKYGSNFWTDLLNMFYKLFGSKRTFATKAQ